MFQFSLHFFHIMRIFSLNLGFFYEIFRRFKSFVTFRRLYPHMYRYFCCFFLNIPQIFYNKLQYLAQISKCTLRDSHDVPPSPFPRNRNCPGLLCQIQGTHPFRSKISHILVHGLVQNLIYLNQDVEHFGVKSNTFWSKISYILGPKSLTFSSKI